VRSTASPNATLLCLGCLKAELNNDNVVQSLETCQKEQCGLPLTLSDLRWCCDADHSECFWVDRPKVLLEVPFAANGEGFCIGELFPVTDRLSVSHSL
jgi:hypothetical protein